MAVTPNTRIRLLKCPIELDNLNQLTFATEEAQRTYFLNLPYIEIENCTYQRKDDVIRFPAHIDTLLEYNYVMYQNTNYSNKWFYAFIEDMTYYSDNTTYIKIATDCYQTWQFNLNIKRSYVIREHTNNDTVGTNTIPENLEKGDMITTNCTPITYLKDSVDSGSDFPENYVIVVGSTIELDTTAYSKIYGDTYCGLYSGLGYYCFPSSDDVDKMLMAVTSGSQTQINTDIVTMFMAPRILVGYGNWAYDEVNSSAGKYYIHKITPLNVDSIRSYTYNVTIPTSIDGYTPTNKKLLTGEFNRLLLTNYVGNSQDFRYELFNGANAQFKLRGALSPSCPISIYPVNYLRSTDAQYASGCYSLPAPPLPLCNWNSDQYTNWLASTANTRKVERAAAYVNEVGGMVNAIGGAMSGSVSGTISGLKTEVDSIIQLERLSAQKADHQKDGNSNTGTIAQADTNYTSSKVFGAYQYCIRAEYARKLDRVFSAIGYRTDEMKIPNVVGRRNWNFVQTQSVAIEATIPQVDLQTIKDMFNRGVTFWHDPATFLDYSQNNDII